MSLTHLWCLVLLAHGRATAVHTFDHSNSGVNIGVNLCVNNISTTKPDPPHNSHMSPTQPHMHGRSTGGLHSRGSWVTSHLFTPLFTLLAGPSRLSVRSQRYLRNAFDFSNAVFFVLVCSTRSLRLSKRRDPQMPAIYRRGRSANNSLQRKYMNVCEWLRPGASYS